MYNSLNEQLKNMNVFRSYIKKNMGSLPFNLRDRAIVFLLDIDNTILDYKMEIIKRESLRKKKQEQITIFSLEDKLC